ncbi:hypothetical protein [Paenibacillus xylanexedens]|uniref:hypothetical protein n=1 Tax=Paenibacillus xylanexedens TaxID=528191 RepID=UPI0011A6216A|nr:hypothetical protein [Paenibacillus xylanexedens]
MERKPDQVLPHFGYVDLSDIRMPMYTIYDQSTADYPGKFVGRLVEGATNSISNCVVVGPTYESVILALPPGLTRMPRNPNDLPWIIETWM